jgi:phosphoenolpyruvate-protein kinase (PTS system EI component)
VPASEGIVPGPVYPYRPVTLDIPERVAGPFLDEMARFSAAIVQAHQELKVIRESVLARTGGEEEAAIFEAHDVMLDDPALEQGVRERV